MVDYRNFYSNRGLWTKYEVPGQPAGANAFGVQYQRDNLKPVNPGDWNANCPALANAPQQGTFDIAGGTAIANSKYDFYVYDSDNDANYDHVLAVPNADGKDCSKAVANLMAGEWADIKLVLAIPAGKTGGFYVKALRFAPDLSQFSLFFTSVTRAVATYNELGPAGSAAFEEYLNANFPSSTAADDGKFTFVFGYLRNRRQILKALPSTTKPGAGNYVEHPAIREINTTWLRVQSDQPTPAHTDGEIFSTAITELEYRLKPACLPVLLPKI